MVHLSIFYIILFINSVGICNTQLSYNKVKRTIERKKNQRYPKEPTTQEIGQVFMEPEIMNKYGYTLDGDAKFYIETIVETDYQFTIFCSQFVIDFIEKKICIGSRKYLMDGTFDKLPVGYYQMLTVSVEYRNDVS